MYTVIFNTSKKRATIQLAMLKFCYEYEICTYTSKCYIHIYMKNYITFIENLYYETSQFEFV